MTPELLKKMLEQSKAKQGQTEQKTGQSKDEAKPKPNPVFSGTVTNIDVSVVQNQYVVKVEGISHTYELDLKLRRHSFQNKQMTFTQLVNHVLENSDYSEAKPNTMK